MVTKKKKTTPRRREVQLYVGTRTREIFYSRNGGDTWEEMPTHLPPVLSLDTAVV